MNTAVIYARFSSAKQNEQSIDGQMRCCEEYAERMGYKVVGAYIDRAMSGTNDNRPQFQKMIEDSNKKLFNYILVWKLDRFARNRYDSVIYKRRLEKNGVKVLSSTETVGVGDESVIIESIYESMAEMYSKQLSQNVKRGMQETALKCGNTGGYLPFGYLMTEEKQIVIDEHHADAVRFIFQQYADGISKTKIAQELNKQGYKTQTGQPFSVNSFRSILTNKKYMGVYRWNKVEVKDGFPAIVSEELFNKCQEVAKLKKRSPGASKAKEEYLLQGKVFCGYCGAPMIGDSGRSKTGTVHHYYVCSTRKRKLGKCDKKREKKHFLEWYVVEQTVNYVLTADRIDYIAEKVVEAYENSFSFAELQKIEKRINQLNVEFDNLANSLLLASSDRLVQAINKKSEALEQELAELEERKYSLTLNSQVQLKKSEVVEWLNQFVIGDPLDLDFKRRIIKTLVNAVYLYDDKLVIYFNLKGSQQVSYIEMLDDFYPESSDVEGSGSPEALKTELFIFKIGKFGTIFNRG